MAKEQGLALNPTKISGACGRLMCCLRYESPVYEELIKLTPKVGSTVILPGDNPVRAYVMEANLVTGNLRVKPENSDVPVTIHRDAVERLQDASRRMTKDDLRDKRNQQAKPDAAAQKAAPAPKPEKPERQEKPERAERPEKPQRPPRQPKPQQEKPAAEKPVQSPAGAALHPEFGENRQQQSAAPQQKPVQHTAPPLNDMDFTEHRAVVEHPERAAQQPRQNGEGNRRPHRPNYRRYQNHRQNKPQNSEQKPQGGNE
jgi:hypothetical protein